MAHLFAADLSLGLFSCRGHRRGDDDPKPNFDIPSIWPQFTQELGKENPPAGFVDYLGASPVLKTGVKAPVPLATNYVSCHPAYSPKSPSTKLVLFYAGTVNVFDNVTADQAQVILSLAGSGNTPVNTLGATTSSYKTPVTSFIEPSVPSGLKAQDPFQKMEPNMPENPPTAAHMSTGERLQVSEYGQVQKLQDLLVPCQAIVPNALPLARKASLARFLEKRKERMRLMAPYTGKGSCQDTIHQELDHLNACTFHMFHNGRWAAPGMRKLGWLNVEDRKWPAILESSKQVLESESATSIYVSLESSRAA